MPSKKSDTAHGFDAADIASAIASEIAKSNQPFTIQSTGKVVTVGDGVISVVGLSASMAGERVHLGHDVDGVVFNIKDNQIDIVALGNVHQLRSGDEVQTTGEILAVPATYDLLGRTVDGLLTPIDGHGHISSKNVQMMPVEKVAPGVIKRQDVRTPFQTGVKVIDALVPIGRGQRELIIGDRGTGKTALALDAIINQSKLNKKLSDKQKRVISIYVAIGQKQSKIAQVLGQLTESDALTDTVIVSASASESASMQYIAPFAATALGEYFMDKGEDVLIVYDDLSKHAWAYRQLSLLLRRPSGREAYPGDIFYLHSRLLERAARMHDNLGGGSLTALPIIETQAADISAYIPTNVISITDGQIFLDPDLFNAGIRPAISVGLSVSRVGGDAQIKAMKQVAGKLKLDLAQYRELAAFAQFGSDVDEDTKKRLNRGRAITHLLIQPQYQPLSVEEQSAVIWLGVRGYLDDVDIASISEIESSFLLRLHNQKNSVLKTIQAEKLISDASEAILKTTAEELMQMFKK